MHNFMNLNLYILYFLMKPFILCFCCGSCRGCFTEAILRLRMFIAVSKYQTNHFPLPRSFYIFDTIFLNIHRTKCQKKELHSAAICSRLRSVLKLD